MSALIVLDIIEFNLAKKYKADYERRYCKWVATRNIKKVLKNPEIKAEYDALEAEYDNIQAMIDARNEQHITEKEWAERTGITQADISRIENGTRNPSLAMVKRIAEGLGMRLKLEFVPTAAKQ